MHWPARLTPLEVLVPHVDTSQLPAGFDPSDAPAGWPLKPLPLTEPETPAKLRRLAAAAHAAAAQGGEDGGGTAAAAALPSFGLWWDGFAEWRRLRGLAPLSAVAGEEGSEDGEDAETTAGAAGGLEASEFLERMAKSEALGDELGEWLGGLAAAELVRHFPPPDLRDLLPQISAAAFQVHRARP